MATKLTNETGSDQNVTAGHNTQFRESRIRNALERLYVLDKQIDGLMEEHIEPLRAEKRDIKKDLKDGLDIPVKRLNARYGLYKEERRAIDNSDDTTLDQIRELFDMAPVGAQMDWLDGISPVKEYEIPLAEE